MDAGADMVSMIIDEVLECYRMALKIMCNVSETFPAEDPESEEHRLELPRPTVWTAKESKAAVLQYMKGGRPKKSTRVVKRIKRRGVKWTELEWQAYGYPPSEIIQNERRSDDDVPIYGTLTKDSHESLEHRWSLMMILNYGKKCAEMLLGLFSNAMDVDVCSSAIAETNSHASRDLDRAELTVISNIGSSPDEYYSEPNEEPRPVSYGSSPSTNTSSRHQRMGSYDTSLTESLLHSTISPAETEDYYGSISSAGVTNYNGSSQIATPSAYSSSSGFVALSIGSELEDTHICTELITPLDCSLFLTGIGLEVSSVVFDLLSSPEKPRYALAGMLCANVAVVLSILELIYEGITKRELLASQNTARSLILMLPEITGFGLATIQSISSVVQFYYYNRHEHNHLNVYLAGVYVCFCLFLFKFGRKSRNH